VRHRLRYSLAAFAALGGAAALAQNTHPTILQYFEAKWTTITSRMPDVFMAGYGSVWLPPPSKGQSGSQSIGYDLFDRFDLGSPGSPTHYGTEAELIAMIDAFHRAGVEVYFDWIMNHNGTWDHQTPNFGTQGSYPGFVVSVPGDPYGDFHTYSAATPWQSTNPGGAWYDLFNGRLLGLIDIAQEKNHQYIRHPVGPGAGNIPAGTIYNIPNPNNARLYPDMALTPTVVTNPGTTRNPGTTNATIYPYNVATPLAGDPVLENATALINRSTRWMLEVIGCDGFRLDAAKHIPSWYWDNLWDTAVYQRRRAFDGSMVTPFSFSEAIDGNNSILNWVRRPGEPGSNQGWPAQGWEFGNRDALDINEAGALRDLVSADGSGSWGNVMSASVDVADDGFNNGTAGVHHVNSHDNAIASDENSNVGEAYVLLRTGHAVVYHNAIEFGPPPNDFPRRNGRDDAMGNGGDVVTKLVNLRNQYGRGWFYPINSTDSVNSSVNDVLVFTRRTPNSVDNVLIALNDREDNNNVETRNVQTTFPPGTRLHELTGNAANPAVDPSNLVPETLVVGADGRLADAANPGSLYLKIPGNRTNNVVHGLGYVVYGPAVPAGTLSVTNVAFTAPPDPVSIPAHARRLTPIDVIQSNSFEIRLDTTPADPLDNNVDNKAVFRIDSGYFDYNGNGSIDYNSSAFEAGFEDFLTQSSPGYTGGTPVNGVYRQTIDATALAEGYHYITVWAYRHRTVGDPLFREFRKVIFIDRGAPVLSLVAPTQTGSGDITTSTFTATVNCTDPDVASVHIFFDRHVSTDLVSLALSGQGIAVKNGNDYSRSFSGVIRGNHRIDVVALGPFGSPTQASYVGINATTAFFAGLGDLNNDNAVNGRDIATFVNLATGASLVFNPAADFNADGLNDLGDLDGFLTRLTQ